MTDSPVLLIDSPAPLVRRLTLNRPDKRNALSNELRGAVFAALEEADRDERVRVTILRGAGSCFSAGYDLSRDVTHELPFQTAAGAGQWARHVVGAVFASGIWRNR
jgi:enoyl-CoA hydratase